MVKKCFCQVFRCTLKIFPLKTVFIHTIKERLCVRQRTDCLVHESKYKCITCKLFVHQSGYKLIFMLCSVFGKNILNILSANCLYVTLW